MKSNEETIAFDPDRDAARARSTESVPGVGTLADLSPSPPRSKPIPRGAEGRDHVAGGDEPGGDEAGGHEAGGDATGSNATGADGAVDAGPDRAVPDGAGVVLAYDVSARTQAGPSFLQALFGLDVREHVRRWVGVARSGRVDGFAAAGIGILALALAVAAGDGESEVPGRAFERALQSHATAQAAAPWNWLTMDPSLPDAVLAQRLVEDPVFEPLSVAAARGGASSKSPAGSVVADDQAGSLDRAQLDRATGSTGRSETVAGELAVRDSVGSGNAAKDRADAVLAAATPVPAAGRSRPHLEIIPGVNGIAVQLVAVVRRDQATDSWSRLRNENIDLLAGLQPQIIDPDGQQVSFYRLHAGPFASAGQAKALCAALAARKVDCMVVDNSG